MKLILIGILSKSRLLLLQPYQAKTAMLLITQIYLLAKFDKKITKSLNSQKLRMSLVKKKTNKISIFLSIALSIIHGNQTFDSTNIGTTNCIFPLILKHLYRARKSAKFRVFVKKSLVI